MAENIVHPPYVPQPTEGYVDPYDFLRSLHLSRTGLFTHHMALDVGDAVLGLSEERLRDSSVWNNFLPRSIKHVLPATLDQAEHILRSRGSVPAVYFSEGDQAEDLRDGLVARGYSLDSNCTDAWMFGDLNVVRAAITGCRSTLPDTVNIRTAKATRRDWFEAFHVLVDARAAEPSRNNPYGPLPHEEQPALADAIWRLLQDETKGYCLMVERMSPAGKRRWTKAVAVATVRYIENSSVGRIAHIENIARLPYKSKAYRGFGKIAMLAAAEAGLKFLARGAQPFVGPARILCLATAPDQRPEEIFESVGFRREFLAYLYTKNTMQSS